MDKCDNCIIRYVCEDQHEFNCINNNYKYYNPESKNAKNNFPDISSNNNERIDLDKIADILEDNKNKMIECIDALWVDNIELNKTGVKRLINSLCKNIIKDIEKQFNNKVEKNNMQY